VLPRGLPEAAVFLLRCKGQMFFVVQSDVFCGLHLSLASCVLASKHARELFLVQSKCKGCKKLASKHRTSQSSQGASSAVGGSAASASTAASSEAKGGKGPKTHSGSGAGSGGRREGGAVSSKDKRAEGI